MQFLIISFDKGRMINVFIKNVLPSYFKIFPMFTFQPHLLPTIGKPETKMKNV